ncbi:hypothetical protein B7R97_02285 [Mycoplasmoides pneumoniae]|uniref:MPN396 family protein n=1 Tax=Mycoplasmoides pneumoniae TaxID=2104 RepID=UPI0009FFF613|nr:hypothetical protein [Mycoplasmoides pneumoniae]ARI12445.1 hypothetical protein B7R97_02285 [Mycoplasmoides pneumoniae]
MGLKKRVSFDWLLKIGIILVLAFLGLFGIIFGSYKLLNDSRLGVVFNGSTTTTVYFLNHKSKDANKELDPTQKKDGNGSGNNTEMITDVNGFLNNIEKSYANSLYAQGFSSVNITKNSHDTSAKELSDKGVFDSSWLVNDGLPSISVTFEQRREEARTRARKRQIDAQVKRNALSAIEHNYKLSLETTDGIVLFDSFDKEFIRNSLTAVVPQTTNTNSALTFEYKLSKNVITKESLHNDFLDFIKSKSLTDSDYNTGNGQKSVEGSGKWFKDKANGSAQNGNKTLVLWKDKEGAVQYVRNIFNVPKGGTDYLTFNEREKNLWDFLHAEGNFSSGDNLFLQKNNNGNSPITKASDITLKNIYYIYAAPTHFSQVATKDNNNKDAADVVAVANSADTRKLRSGDATGFSGLFSNYILAEIRTEDPVAKNGDPVKVNATLQSFLDSNNQRLEHGGNIKFQVANFVNNDGSYVPASYLEASRVKVLLSNGFPETATIAAANTKLVNAPLSNTLARDVSNFASSFIALGVIILLATIALGIRYKLLGLYKALALALSAISSLAFFSAVGGFVDVFSFVGIFFVVAVNIINLITLAELFLRNIKNNASIVESWKLCLKRSFFTMIETHICWLLSALVVIYLSNYQVQQLGTLMAVSAITSYFLNYGLGVILVWLFVSSHSGLEWRFFLYKKDAQALTKTSSNYSILTENNDIQTDFFISKNQHDFFGKKKWSLLFIWLTVLAFGVVMLGLYLGAPQLLGNFLAADIESSTGIMLGVGVISLLYLLYSLPRYGVAYGISYLIALILLAAGLFGAMYLANFIFRIDQSTIQLIIFVYLFWLFFQARIGQTTIWTYCYWFKRSLKDRVFVKNLFNDNVNSQWRLDLIGSSVLILLFIVYAAFNFGGINGTINLVIFYLIAIVALFSVFVNGLPLFSFGLINGWLSPYNYVQIHITLRHKKQMFKEVDQIEEQLISGINSF